NGGAKPKLKGVREAYRDKGFTAKALQEALGDKSLADFEREQKERYSDKSKISLRAKQLVYSELELKKNKNGEAYHGNETSNTARSDERPSRQFEVQENDYR
ncbi:hypothetical protein, partial [Vibrio anguillarum]